MCKEINARIFVINALYFVKDEAEPLSLDPKDKKYFWRYTFRASQKFRDNFKNIFLYTDRYNLENVLWNNNLYIEIQNGKLSIDKEINIEEINKCLGSKIREKIPSLFKEAYTSL